jgi:hypothetical protein
LKLTPKVSRAFGLGKIQRDYFFKSAERLCAIRKIEGKEEEHKQGGGPELFLLFAYSQQSEFYR